MSKSSKDIDNDAKVDIHSSSLIDETSIENYFELENVNADMYDEELRTDNDPEFSGTDKTMFRSNTFAVYYISKYWLLFIY